MYMNGRNMSELVFQFHCSFCHCRSKLQLDSYLVVCKKFPGSAVHLLWAALKYIKLIRYLTTEGILLNFNLLSNVIIMYLHLPWNWGAWNHSTWEESNCTTAPFSGEKVCSEIRGKLFWHYKESLQILICLTVAMHKIHTKGSLCSSRETEMYLLIHYN